MKTETEIKQWEIYSAEKLFDYFGRCAKSKTVAKISRETEISLSQLYRIFKNKHDPGIKNILKISKSLGMKLILEYKISKPANSDSTEKTSPPVA